MKYKLLAVDVDGTLLDDEHHLSEKNREAVRKFQSRGGKVLLFSGRGYKALKTLVEGLQLKEAVATQNGSLILDCTGSKILHAELVPVETCQRILEYSKTKGFWPLIYQKDHVYSSLRGRYLNVFETCMGEEVIYTKDICKCYQNIPLGKILILDKPERVKKFRDWLTADSKLQASADLAYDFSLEIGGTDKGNALKWAAGYYGIPREEIAAIGDGENDKNMLRYAGLSVAMGNAMEGLKQIAHKVTLSNRESGVAYAIERYLN